MILFGNWKIFPKNFAQSLNKNKYNILGFWSLFILITSCIKTQPAPIYPTTKITQATSQNQPIKPEQWRAMTGEEQTQNWQYILNSPLGIAALNQLAIEGFISPTCPKTFYVSQEYGSFQTLLQVKCPSSKGVSIAVGYQEMRVIFNRFEDNIENFEVTRIYDSQ